MNELKDSLQEAELRNLDPAITKRLIELGVKNIDYDLNRMYYYRHGKLFAITIDIWNEKTGKPEKI